MPRNIYTLTDFWMSVFVPKGGIEMPCRLLGTVTNLLDPCSATVLALARTPKTEDVAIRLGLGCRASV